MRPARRGSSRDRAYTASAIGDNRDRQVDEEDPAPREALGQQPAEDRPGGRGGAVDRAPDAEREPAVAALVGGAEQRDRGREHRRGADPLNPAGGDQHGRARSQPARQRRQREHDQAGDVDRPAADLVRVRADPQQQRGQRQRVDVDDPLQARERRVQIGGHVGQRDVHDRDVDQEHEGAERHRDEWKPFTHADECGRGSSSVSNDSRICDDLFHRWPQSRLKHVKLDRLDRQLLHALQFDGRVSFRVLGEIAGRLRADGRAPLPAVARGGDRARRGAVGAGRRAVLDRADAGRARRREQAGAGAGAALGRRLGVDLLRRLRGHLRLPAANGRAARCAAARPAARDRARHESGVARDPDPVRGRPRRARVAGVRRPADRRSVRGARARPAAAVGRGRCRRASRRDRRTPS